MKSVLLKTVILCCFFLNKSYSSGAQSVKDIDGNEYKISKCGLQEWTSSNLNVTHFRNGDAIAEAQSAEEWISAGSTGSPAWCYYNNDSLNDRIYGKLYNWFAINDPRGLAPEGWRISVNEDWTILVKNLLGVDYAGTRLKSITGWKTRNGINKIGFAALPGGYREKEGSFKSMGLRGQWWSNSEPVEIKKSNQIYSFVLNNVPDPVAYIKVNKEDGYSVRCLKEQK